MLIGCIPNSKDFRHPADRRRYVYYFEKRGFSYELADFEKYYGAIYVSVSADLGLWSKYKSRHIRDGSSPKVVFDLSDAYLAASPLSDCLRSFYYYLSRRTSVMNFSYRRIILNMMESSDVVLCGSLEQKKELDRLHRNVLVMRDYFEGDISSRKTSCRLRRPRELNILWEGFSHGNLRCFELLRDILSGIQDFEVHLHVVTDPSYCRVGGAYFCRPTIKILEEVFEGSQVRIHLYDWCGQTFSAIAACCDLAIIPIPDDPIMRRKPENKLLLLWSIGLPAIVANTESYVRVMNQIGHNFTASSLEDWRGKIVRLASDEAVRGDYMRCAAEYLEEHCSERVILDAWDRVFLGNLGGEKI